MPIAEIIHEIDAYLSRLRQARELLSGRITNVPQEKNPQRKKPLVRRADPSSSTTHRSGKNKTPSNRPVDHQKGQKRLGDASNQIPKAVLPQTTNMEQSVKTEPERIIPQTIAITRLPASRRARSFRSYGDRPAKRPSRTAPESAQPAIALAGQTNTRIVVVSADQVQRERAQAAPPVVRRPRIATSGLTGRLAFEALFADSIDPSKGSSH